MGSSGSKQAGMVVSKEGAIAQPPPEPPYAGPAVQYQFINTEVVISAKVSFGFSQTPLTTSNIDSYYPLLAAQYAQGYKLLSFYHVPGQSQQTGFFSVEVATCYQGIFGRYPSVPPTEPMQLRIEKSVLQTQYMATGIIFRPKQGTVSDTSHIMDCIARNTVGGGRLICIEMTGHTQRQSFGQAMSGVSPLMGVDVFFEIPTHPMAEQYVYNCVAVPMQVTYKYQGLKPVPVVHCDWMGTLAYNLGQGWRLIEIFLDMSSFTQAQGFSSAICTQNTLWFFEKPASRMNDMTPVYQGTFIVHEISIKMGFKGTRTSANWEPIIQEMGNKGWELACILETPDSQAVGMTTVVMKCLLFFQRLIVPSGNMVAPPPYEATMQGQPNWQGRASAAGFNVPSPPSSEKMGY